MLYCRARENLINKGSNRHYLQYHHPQKKLFVPRPVDNVRNDEIAHWPLLIDKQQQSKHCINSNTTNTCSKC